MENNSDSNKSNEKGNKNADNQDKNENQEEDNQYVLSPIIIGKVEPAYKTVEDIAKKLNDKNVNNIAITGPYGSGKSSILQTLEKTHKGYGYLNISLATLQSDDENKTNKQIDAKIDANTDNTDINKKIEQREIANRMIEYSILQQIIYRENASKLPQSGFNRIKVIDNEKEKEISKYIILFIACLLFTLKPSFLFLSPFLKDTWVGHHSSYLAFIIVIISLCIIGCLLYKLFKKSIAKFYNSKINKVSLREGEVDFKENESIFNKYLDEIIYFFQVTDYNVVVIEDLDRFDTSSDILLKLRELNQILNDSKAILDKDKHSRHIVFIYALRDDIFKNTDRTKFFDYITTVIPVINISNASDKLKKMLRDKKIDENEVSDEDYEKLGFYIDDMRILLNIINEFIQYRKRLISNKLKMCNLLAMIIYKNYYPKDFSDLHCKKGKVYEFISNKSNYIKDLTKGYDDGIAKLEKEYEEIKNKYIKFSIPELRSVYIIRYIEKIPSFSKFSDGTNEYEISQVINDNTLFNKIQTGQINKYTHYIAARDIYNRPIFQRKEDLLNISFKDIEKEVDPDHSYEERKNMYPERLNQIKNEIIKLKRQIQQIKFMPLHEILTKINFTDSFKEDKKKLIPYFLLQGYIDESYEDYISYFYPGSLTEEDRQFVASVRIGQSMKYDYHLTKIENVIKKLYGDPYSNGTALNIDLLYYMDTNKDVDDYDYKIDSLIDYIIKEKKIDFVLKYYDRCRNNIRLSSTICKMLNKWKDFPDSAFAKNKDENVHSILEMMINYYDKERLETYNNNTFKNILKSSFVWITSNISNLNFDNLKSISDELDIKYENINEAQMPTSSVPLYGDKSFGPQLDEYLWMEFIIEKSHYVISTNDIKAIVDFFTPDNDSLFKEASYTSIAIASKRDVATPEQQAFIKYADDNIKEFVKSFPNESIKEFENYIVRLINMPMSGEDPLKEYIAKQQEKISVLDSIKEDKYDLALSINRIKATWENINIYITTEDKDIKSDTLKNFIIENIPDLSLQNVSEQITDETIKKQLFKYYIGTNILPINAYKELIKAFDLSFDTLPDVEDEKIKILINANKIPFSKEIYTQISSHPECISIYLINYKDDYIKDTSSYVLTTQAATDILKSNQLNGNEKLIVISSLPENIIISNKELLHIVTNLCIKNEINKIDENKVIAMMKALPDEDSNIKKNIFIKKIENEYNEDFVKKGLILLGEQYSILAEQSGKSPKLDKNKINEIDKKLLDDLKKYNFISSYNDEKKFIRVNARDTRQNNQTDIQNSTNDE